MGVKKIEPEAMVEAVSEKIAYTWQAMQHERKEARNSHYSPRVRRYLRRVADVHRDDPRLLLRTKCEARRLS